MNPETETAGLERCITQPKYIRTEIVSVKERDGNLVEVYDASGSLQNWGGNVEFKPKLLFVPKSKEGACQVVKWACENKHRVRTSAYRHTWNNVYADEGDVQITFLSPRHIDSDLSATNDPAGTGAGADFKKIEFVAGCKTPNHAFCRLGSAVTNDEFREFCESVEFEGNYWTLPLNVILVENTICGTVSSICHGSGSSNRTLSDLVVEIEFVNAKGELQIVSRIGGDNELMKSAAGSFGLLGVITSLTITLDKMSYATLEPKREELLVSVPPPKGTRIQDLPKHLQSKFYRQEELDDMIRQKSYEFHAHCQNDYYAEWFWFIFNDNCWANTWNKHEPDTPLKELWSQFQRGLWAIFQKAVSGLLRGFVRLFNDQGSELLNNANFVRYMGSTIMKTLQATMPKNPIPLPEALHFQRLIRIIHCRDVEIEIPIPIVNGQPDWNICQMAWWDAINIIYKRYEKDGSIPINLTLEMRIMGGSDITMAAQKGNDYTCSIEVLSNLLVSHEEWAPAVEEIIKKWTSYTDSLGRPLNIRTHWAKEWDGLKFGDRNARDFVRDCYKDTRPVFLAHLEEIARQGGYSLDEMKRMFSNNLWDDVIYKP